MILGPARFWDRQSAWAVACRLCPNACVLVEGHDGPCGTRGNRAGEMRTLHHHEVAALAVDPMEKKPLYHFLPGAPILSVAAAGCNLQCKFCQNWRLSQDPAPAGEEIEPSDLVDMARREGAVGIAFTYSEPLVWIETLLDVMPLVRDAGLVNVIVSNGYINPEPLAELITWLDAANVDLKSMDEFFYREICRGDLQPVLESLAALHAAGVHLEITNLVIPGHNDDDAQLDRLRDRVADLSPDIPLHLTGYRPAWCFDAPPTPAATLERAAIRCAQRLHHVYVGNTTLLDWSDTRCPGCGRILVARAGGHVRCHLERPRCDGCGRAVPLILAGRRAST